MEQGAISGLITDSLKLHVGRNEHLDQMRSGLHVKAMKMMRELMQLEKEEPQCGSKNLEQRGMLQLLNYLIVDYFNWHGFRNTMKTFEMETGEKARPKPREKLQQELNGKFFHNELPILLQMVLKETKENYEGLLDQRLWANIPLKPLPESKKLKKSLGRARLSTAKKRENKIEPIEEKRRNMASNKQKEISTKDSLSPEKSKQQPIKPTKESKTRTKNLEIFTSVLKDFPALKHEIRKKTMNKHSTQTKSDATAQAILDIVGTLQGSKSKTSKLQSSRGPPAPVKEKRYKGAPIKDSPVTSASPAKTMPRDPVNNRPKKKVNVRQRMVESQSNSSRAH